MATVETRWFSLNFDDPWAQRIASVGVCALGVAVAATIHRNGGLKLIVEGAKVATPKVIGHAAKAAASATI